MITSIRRLGNSQGVSIPRSVLDAAGLSIDAQVEMLVDGSSIVLRPVTNHPRAGWADAASLLTDDGDDAAWLAADLDSAARHELT